MVNPYQRASNGKKGKLPVWNPQWGWGRTFGGDRERGVIGWIAFGFILSDAGRRL